MKSINILGLFLLLVGVSFQEVYCSQPQVQKQREQEQKQRKKAKGRSDQLTDDENDSDVTTISDDTTGEKSKNKHKKHERICPYCGQLSIHCPADQARIAQGNVLPCACNECSRRR